MKKGCALALALVFSGTAFAQTPNSIPRAADGRPDLSGVWITGALSLLIDDKEARAIADADRAAGRVLPPPEPLSYKPEADAKRQYYLDRRGIDDPMARCFISGVPRITTRPLPFQIFQTKDQVLILYEAHHAFSGVGTIHSDKMHVVERYTRDSATTVRYDVTVEDPEVLAAVARARDLPAAPGRAPARIRVHREQRRSAALREAAADRSHVAGEITYEAAEAQRTRRISF